jgi:hypothetical protein
MVQFYCGACEAVFENTLQIGYCPYCKGKGGPDPRCICVPYTIAGGITTALVAQKDPTCPIHGKTTGGGHEALAAN